MLSSIIRYVMFTIIIYYRTQLDQLQQHIGPQEFRVELNVYFTFILIIRQRNINIVFFRSLYKKEKWCPKNIFTNLRL